MTEALATLAARAGIQPDFTDVTGRDRATPPETQAALLAAMGLPAATEAEAADTLAALPGPGILPPWLVADVDTAPALDPGDPWRLTHEDGTETEGHGPVPPLPLGRHRLEAAGAVCWILSAPPRLPLPPRGWGLMVPLAGLRPEGAGGVGDYDDLARMAEGAARHGAQFLGLNPVHAGFPSDPNAVSPYTPSHRRRLSIRHIACEGPAPVPDGGLIDYATDLPRHMAALNAAFAAFRARGDSAAFDAWRAAEGDALERFALHQALSEVHGPYWRAWPAEFHDPAGAAAQLAAHDLADRIDFHAWAQWRAETGVATAQGRARDAGMGLGLYLDLAVGTHPAGAETWEDRDSFAFGASLGAPPDAFATEGQNWNLAPFNPRTLVASGFAPLAETLARQLRLSGLLRIDHIIGFERAYWVPDSGAPGAFVQMPRDAVFAVARIEAARAGAVIVGEDLGHIPEGLRHAMDSGGLLGCRLTMFERGWDGAFRHPQDWPEAVVASFSTHDLPTWKGWRSGAEIAARHRLGQIDTRAAAEALDARDREVAALDHATGLCSDAPRDSAARMHAHLAATRARLVAVQVENVLDMAEQPNLPGTTDEYPNWRARLPQGPEAIASDPRLAETAEIMRRHGR